MVCEAGRVTGAAGGQKVRVVVGDDHPLFRDGVVRALNSSGSIDVVAEADDGVAALALIREHGPQVALLDYRMPGLDGAQVAAAVRRDELPTRVLLISAHDESAIVYSALQDGAAGFISKESSRSELVDAGHAARTSYEGFSRPDIVTITIGADRWREELAAAGRAGGVIRSALPGPGSRR